MVELCHETGLMVNFQVSICSETTAIMRMLRFRCSQIASLLAIDAFALTRDDGSPLDVHAEIGREEQGVRVVRAHDTDNWQPYRWRVDVHGLVEQTARVFFLDLE